MYIDTIRETVNDTKTESEWRQEIFYLKEQLDHLRVSVQLHVPDGWEGDKWMNLSEFTIVEEGKEIVCDGMWKETKGLCSIRVKSEDKYHNPPTSQLYQIHNLESYRTVVKVLLQGIDDVEEWKQWWLEL